MPTNQQPIADMRRVTFTEIDGARYVSKAGLCQFCGITGECGIKANKMLSWHDKTLQDCNRFQPVLTFRSPLRGFGDVFNTFRLGPAWSKRVKPGTVVALYDTKAGKVFGRARVTEVYFGDKEEMAVLYGADNHSMLHYSGEESVGVAMLKILRNAFGNLIYQSHGQATVIYLQRI